MGSKETVGESVRRREIVKTEIRSRRRSDRERVENETMKDEDKSRVTITPQHPVLSRSAKILKEQDPA